MLFDGDVIVLAGGTGRVGGATLHRLHAEGARVMVVSRSIESAEASIEGLERAVAVAADLNDAAATAFWSLRRSQGCRQHADARDRARTQG